jgi:dipeptidase E
LSGCVPTWKILNSMEKNIFIGGGGGEKESVLIDNLFFKTIKRRKIAGVVYIPVALTSRPYSDCLKWFKKVVAGRVDRIQMWTSLKNKSLRNLQKKVAVYIGGGDTGRLLRLVKAAKFDKKLSDFVNHGGIVYGGSAGGIVLSKDIRTATEVKATKNTEGLNLLHDLLLVCHYSPERDSGIAKISKLLKTRVLAIPENAGLFVTHSKIEAVGPGKCYHFSEKSKKGLKIIKI